MNKFLTVAVFVILTALPGWADTLPMWQGTISATVDSVGCVPFDGLVCPHVGDILTGTYQYMSPTLDFTWVCPGAPIFPHCNLFDPPISGEVDFPDGFHNAHDPIVFAETASEIKQFSVVGGHLTDFEWDGEINVDFTWTENGFRMRRFLGLDHNGTVGGHAVFSDPVPVPEPSTVMLLGIGLAALLAYAKARQLVVRSGGAKIR
jgi:hypothetical protein